MRPPDRRRIGGEHPEPPARSSRRALDRCGCDLCDSVLDNGLFRWVSPLGRIYFTKGEPIRPDLPDPDPAHYPGEETAAEVDQRLRRYDPRILRRPAKDPPRPPPPPRPDPPPDDEPPPF